MVLEGVKFYGCDSKLNELFAVEIKKFTVKLEAFEHILAFVAVP